MVLRVPRAIGKLALAAATRRCAGRAAQTPGVCLEVLVYVHGERFLLLSAFQTTSRDDSI